jgi:GT2 family glycosyltransferase
MVFLITPSGGRPIQIKLCEQWMRNQTYSGQVVWIIVDDCLPTSIESIARDNWTIIKLYPQPYWSPGFNSQSRNIAIGLNAVVENYRRSDVEAVFIIEDDDYYSPRYLTEMMKRMGSYDAIGETHTIYYNVASRLHLKNMNTIHSSLFQTAFSYDAIDIMREAFNERFIDCKFWALVKNKYLFQANNLSVGIKGMPGRGGIGAGHVASHYSSNDVNLNFLRALIGNDANHYSGYYRRSNLLQPKKYA